MRRLACLPLLIGSLWCAAAPAAELSQPLKTLLSVGPMGANHAEAMAAWKQVAGADADQLPVILAALDGANPLAANWLHAAVDTVAERQLNIKGTPPIQLLEQFLADTQHEPRARRLAFDWLMKFDTTARDRLVPGFLNDPSVELRRDAVAQLLDQGKALLEANDKAETKAQAVDVYQKALSGARDLDQIDAIVKQLKELGVDVDQAKHFGFIMQWKVIGPFDNTGESAFNVEYPPEEEIKSDAQYPGKNKDKPVTWQEYVSTDARGIVDLNAALGKANSVTGYATVDFVSPREQEVDIRIGCVCAHKVWLNGKLIISNNVYHSGEKIDQYIGRGTLKAGSNTILVKVLQNEQPDVWAQDWRFQLRVCDRVGTAVLATKRPPPGKIDPPADKRPRSPTASKAEL